MKIKPVFILIPLLIFLVLFVFPVAKAEIPCQSPHGGYCVNLTAAGITGLDFLPTPAGPGIGNIIGAIYKFGLGLVGIAALIMLVVSGIAYLTAGDNEKWTGQAKTWIGNAIFGLVLALISFLILKTINPTLVQELKIGLEAIKYTPTSQTTPARKTEPTPYDQQLAGSNNVATSREERDSLIQLLQDKKISTQQQIESTKKEYTEWQATFEKSCKDTAGGSVRKDTSDPSKVILICNTPKK